MTSITAEQRWNANRKLAALRGWRDIQPYGQYGHAMGRFGDYGGYRILPSWTEDWYVCMELAVEMKIGIDYDHLDQVIAKGAPGPMRLDRHDSPLVAVRYAIVVAAIKLLEQKLLEQEKQSVG